MAPVSPRVGKARGQGEAMNIHCAAAYHGHMSSNTILEMIAVASTSGAIAFAVVRSLARVFPDRRPVGTLLEVKRQRRATLDPDASGSLRISPRGA